MNTKEATKIIQEILEWQFILMGVKERVDYEKTIDLNQYSLQELLQANKLVSANNKRKRSLQEYWSKKNGKSKGISIQMTCADRVIAGVYFALNFETDREMKVLVNDVGVGLVKAEY